MAQSERVALFVTYGHATLQERRRRLLECANEVRFPVACVGSEKIVKNIRVFTHDELKSQNPFPDVRVRLPSFPHQTPQTCV